MTAVDVSKILNEEKLDAIFTMFDTSGDQKVSLPEIKGLLEACREIDDAMVDRAIKEFDGHGEQELSLVEFKEFIRKLLTATE